MSREEALHALAELGDAKDQHDAQMMLAGPVITPKEAARLNDWFPMLTPLAMSVRLALRSMARGG